MHVTAGNPSKAVYQNCWFRETRDPVEGRGEITITSTVFAKMSVVCKGTVEDRQRTTLHMESQENKPEETVDASGAVNATENKYVSWDGPKDPTHPRNWSLAKKRSHILLVALITFLTCENNPQSS